MNIQYSGQGVVIEKAYLNINQVCLFSFTNICRLFVCILQTLCNLHYLLYVYSMILNIWYNFIPHSDITSPINDCFFVFVFFQERYTFSANSIQLNNIEISDLSQTGIGSFGICRIKMNKFEIFILAWQNWKHSH